MVGLRDWSITGPIALGEQFLVDIFVFVCTIHEIRLECAEKFFLVPTDRYLIVELYLNEIKLMKRTRYLVMFTKSVHVLFPLISCCCYGFMCNTTGTAEGILSIILCTRICHRTSRSLPIHALSIARSAACFVCPLN